MPARVAPHARCERRATAHTVRARAGRVRARADKESESKSIERMFTKGVSMRGLGKSRPDVGASLGERRRCRRDSLSDSAGGGSSMCRTSSSVGIRGARDCSRLDVARASKHQQGERVCGKGHSGGTALRWGHAHASGERPRPRQRPRRPQRRGERGPRASHLAISSDHGRIGHRYGHLPQADGDVYTRLTSHRLCGQPGVHPRYF